MRFGGECWDFIRGAPSPKGGRKSEEEETKLNFTAYSRDLCLV